MFTSRKVWEVVGGFDTVFGNKEHGTWGYEDVDWSYRCQRLGFKLRGVETNYFPFYHIENCGLEKPEWKEKGLLEAHDLLMGKYASDDIEKFPRTGYPFTRRQMELRGPKLNVGCYGMILDGFTNIDINPDCRPDVLCSALDVKYPDNSISVILASQFLEHVTYTDAEKLVRMWFNMLHAGGELIIEVPDCSEIDEKLKSGEIDQETYNVYKHGRNEVIGMQHHVEFTKESLIRILVDAGFHQIRFNSENSDSDPNTIRFDCIKESF